VAAIPLAALGPEHPGVTAVRGRAGIKIDRAHATGALHSRTVEKSMAAEKAAKIARLFRISSISHGKATENRELRTGFRNP
jgi:hypothetical protein